MHYLENFTHILDGSKSHMDSIFTYFGINDMLLLATFRHAPTGQDNALNLGRYLSLQLAADNLSQSK